VNEIGSAQPLYLDEGAERFFALFHPAVSPRGRTAVVLCPPFGWDDIGSYRSRRQWAERLALDAHPALRLDLPGSGDSMGGAGDPHRLDSWAQALIGASQWLRRATDANRVAVVGMGLTGIAAVRAALDSAAIDELILWGVPSRGRSIVRELKAFVRMELANVLDEGEQPPAAATSENGELVVNGYRLSGATVAELEQLDLSTQKPSPACALRRALLLERDGIKVDERLSELLARAGASVTAKDGPGYGAMTCEPQDALAPTAVFALVSSWLQEQEPAAGPASAPPASPAPGAHPTLELTEGQAQLRETPVYVDRGEEGRLFGILCEPVGERRQLCGVLLNAGPQRHTGPNRMWVEIARRWAALGVPTLRVDLAAIGDSDGDSEPLVRVASLYSPEYVSQTRGVLDMLQARGLPPRFVLLGLCSGAYWSAHAALQDERIVGTVMLNPRALIWDEWRYTVLRTRDLRERLLRADTWRRVLRGEITPARHMETARSIAARGASTLKARLRGRGRDPRQGEQDAPVEELFDALSERDQRTLLLLTGREPLREEFALAGVFDRLERWPALRLLLRGTSADTHTLTPLWLQHQVHELVDAAIRAELERTPGA
jgi:pimeloyl-ACP methyl ester carboxylesterase